MNRSGVFFSPERTPAPTGIINMVKVGHIVVQKSARDQHMFLYFVSSRWVSFMWLNWDTILQKSAYEQRMFFLYNVSVLVVKT